MTIEPSNKIYIKESPVHGLGVFAKVKIEENEVFEICPIIDIGMIRGEVSPTLLDYRFNWPQGDDWEKQVIALGFGCLYNHSNNANANWRSNTENKTFEFYATKKIEPNDEIFVWYGGVEYWNDGRSTIEIK